MFWNHKNPSFKQSVQRYWKDTVKRVKKAAKANRPVFGVKNPSHLINLINFDIIFGCVPDRV